MVVYDEELWRMILITVDQAKLKLILKIPERMLFPKPRVAGTIILDREIIDGKIRDALHIDGFNKPSSATYKTMKPRVFSAYIIE